MQGRPRASGEVDGRPHSHPLESVDRKAAATRKAATTQPTPLPPHVLNGVVFVLQVLVPATTRTGLCLAKPEITDCSLFLQFYSVLV